MSDSMDPKSAQKPSGDNGNTDQTNVPSSSSNAQISYSGIGGKESEAGVGLGSFEIPELTEIGKDIELPPEVEKAGVKVTPTQVSVPKVLQKAGVAAAGTIQPAKQTSVQTVPLTDDQIAAGLKLGIKSSWRWLAEWCVRKLKQLKRAVKK